MQLMRAGGKGGEAFLKGGFKGKMDKNEAMQILGIRWVYGYFLRHEPVYGVLQEISSYAGT